jgi:uncharacterized protein
MDNRCELGLDFLAKARSAPNRPPSTSGALMPAVLALCAAAAVGSDVLHTQTPIAMLQALMVLIAVFVSSVVAAIAGFAFSAVAAALLAHVYEDPAEMVRSLLVCSIAVQVYCNARLLRQVRWREVTPYLIGGMASAPFGIFILKHLSSGAHTFLLGIVLVSYAVYAMATPLRIDRQRSIGMDMAIGALGGITGGIAAFPGAFPVIWCAARGLSKDQQRAICQPYILAMQVCTLGWFEYAYYGQTGSLLELWTFVPVALVGAWLGFEIFRRCSQEQFKMTVLVLLAVCGALLIAKGW